MRLDLEVEVLGMGCRRRLQSWRVRNFHNSFDRGAFHFDRSLRVLPLAIACLSIGYLAQQITKAKDH